MRDKEPMTSKSRCHRDVIVGLSRILGSDIAELGTTKRRNTRDAFEDDSDSPTTRSWGILSATATRYFSTRKRVYVWNRCVLSWVFATALEPGFCIDPRIKEV